VSDGDDRVEDITKRSERGVVHALRAAPGDWRGELVAIAGAGSGKSTLMNVLARLIGRCRASVRRRSVDAERRKEVAAQRDRLLPGASPAVADQRKLELPLHPIAPTSPAVLGRCAWRRLVGSLQRVAIAARWWKLSPTRCSPTNRPATDSNRRGDPGPSRPPPPGDDHRHPHVVAAHAAPHPHRRRPPSATRPWQGGSAGACVVRRRGTDDSPRLLSKPRGLRRHKIRARSSRSARSSARAATRSLAEPGRSKISATIRQILAATPSSAARHHHTAGAAGHGAGPWPDGRREIARWPRKVLGITAWGSAGAAGGRKGRRAARSAPGSVGALAASGRPAIRGRFDDERCAWLARVAVDRRARRGQAVSCGDPIGQAADRSARHARRRAAALREDIHGMDLLRDRVPVTTLMRRG
jgi:hypothetical protein